MVCWFGILGCVLLAFNLNPLVLKVYSITCPAGLFLYFIYGFHKSKLAIPSAKITADIAN